VRDFDELLERLQQARDARDVRVRSLRFLKERIRFDGGCIVCPRARAPSGSVFIGIAPARARLWEESATRYAADLAKGVTAMERQGGAFIDTHVYSDGERSRLRFFRELVRPQQIRSQLIARSSFRGQTVSQLFAFRRSDWEFTRSELKRVVPLLKLIGMAEMAFERPARSLSREGSLAARAQQVAIHVANGLTNAEIALLLGTSVNTVRNQVHAILAKLALSSRAELAAWAHRSGAPHDQR
jgi:DNA-binding CsgD family transcriptional regulator